MTGSCCRQLRFTPLLLVSVVALLASTPRPHPGDAVAGPGEPDLANPATVNKALGQLPLHFIENRGQAHDRVAFYVQGRDTDIYFTDEGVTFALTNPRSGSAARRERWAVNLGFVETNPEAKAAGEDRTGAVVSYFKGPASDWKTGLATYSTVSYRNLWHGIDLLYSGSEGHLKYAFVVAPGADPGQIQLAYRGATSVRITADGRLAVETPVAGFEDDRPYAYQEIDGERVEVPAKYVLKRDEESDAHHYGFHVGSYDPTRPLILDPVLYVYAGFIGGSSNESGNNVAVDGSGNAYVTGWSISSEASFPVTVGPDTTHNGGTFDTFVAKVAADGSSLVYAGYIGGSGSDFGNRIAVDGSGRAYVSGQTNSTQATFPVTGGPDLTHGGGDDAFVARVAADGSTLEYCGYIGGSGTDGGGGIAVDTSGNAYVTGRTTSSEASLPVTGGPDLTFNGATDVFVAKLDSFGSFVYLGYLGGTDTEEGNDLGIDTSGNAYVTGFTRSDDGAENFPVAGGPDLSYNGGDDVFIAKVNSAGTALDYCGYIGGTGSETAFGLAVDGSGNAYLSGKTSSTEASGFPVTVGPDLTYNGGTNDIFVAKVDSTGASLTYCGYIGGSGNEVVSNDIGIDGSGNAHLVGYTSSTDLPVIRGPDLTFNGGTYDGLIAKVEASGASLSYCGYIGGSGNDYAHGIAVDSTGNAYVAGETTSDETTFPETVGPDLTFNGVSDAWVAKIEDTGGTAVELVSFAAASNDGAVDIEWETGSEIDNLGFHLYRSLSKDGPYERITSKVIPGLGSSPEGAHYAYRDSGLSNGVTHFYQLEDIETTGATELHGPVWATPTSERVAEGNVEGEEEETSEEGSLASTSRITYGNPSANELKVRRRGKGWLELELITMGFHAIPQDDGSVALEVPGFEDFGDGESPDVPTYRIWQDVIAGRKVTLEAVKTDEVSTFTGLRPSSSKPMVVASRDGTVEAGRRRVKRRTRHSYYPESWAELLSVGFQGAVKKAWIEMAPLRWDATADRLVLAGRLVVRLSIGRRDRAEWKPGKSHHEVDSHSERQVLTRLAVTESGLYGVRFESVFGNRGRSVRTREVRLSRQGEPVAFFVGPNPKRFQRGSTLYFLSEGASLNPYGKEAVYELEWGAKGSPMGERDATPSGRAASFYWKTVSREENRLYQPTFVGRDDLWLWDWILGPMTKSYSFEVSQLSPVSERSQVRIWLHGASDFPAEPDHHVRVYVNGTLVTESWWDGKAAHDVEAAIGAGVLREGANLLQVEEVGDTEASYSMVMLDRFEVAHPAALVAEHGTLTGSFRESGTVRISGLPADTHVFDTTGTPQRLVGVQADDNGVTFRAESDHRYLAVSGDSVKAPEVRPAGSSKLKKDWNRADYLVIGPRHFLPAAAALLSYRRDEGLIAGAIATEDIYDEFGYGEATPESIRDFLSYAYHHWREPTLKYVVLLGDGTYDPKDYLATGVRSQVPVKSSRTQFLWTASDPWFAAINGDDLLPDVAIGRLPAASVEEVRSLVGKILAYERKLSETELPQLSDGIVLVTDNPDTAGDFDSDADEIASTILDGQNVQKIYLSELGTSATRTAIVNAFEEGSSLMSYTGHGTIHLWAQENLFNVGQVDSLSPQTRQPLLLTINCLNGYFHFPYRDSLSEELVKAEDKGVIAAFSPTGLSFNGPAHRFHKALLQNIVTQRHERLGDAILASQTTYAATGALPELLTIYHLLGDPGLRLRRE